MKGSAIERERLTSILRQAYLAEERFEGGEAWQSSVMTRIREMGPPASASHFLPMFEHIVWRLAPITSLMALTLAALSIAVDFLAEYNLFQLFLNALEDSAVLQLFGG